jgi:hypothetical protein
MRKSEFTITNQSANPFLPSCLSIHTGDRYDIRVLFYSLTIKWTQSRAARKSRKY